MFVSGVRPSEEIYSYNSIKLNVLRKEMVEADHANGKLDIKKAMADMAKDLTLQQYQYYVGKSSADKHESIVFRTGKSFALQGIVGKESAKWILSFFNEKG